LARTRLTPSECDHLGRVLRLVRASEQKRNVIVHSLWGAGPGATVIRTKYTAKERHGLAFQREEMSTDSLDAIALDIATATFEIEAFGRVVGIDTSTPYAYPDLTTND
jgi:predicted naringenin-chalcone synthase